LADHSKSFFAELKRRNVYRVGIAYVIVGWLALQALDIVVPIMRAPEWFSQLVLVLLVLGLPFALIFAWAFELTPEGLKLEKDVDRSESITHETGQRINQITIGVLVIAVGILLVDKFMLGPGDVEVTAEDVAPTDAVTEDLVATVPSIAVLPFANMSADENSVFFSDGLADTLLHMLAQIREIRVAARTSSFQFRDQNTDITAIADALNVSTILEGSVQRAGNTVRVTAQLIEAETGFHLWSGNYDRNLDDIFAIQDEIANEVVAALKITLLGESAERLAKRDTENLEAYTEYLLGINDLAEFSFDSLPRAEKHFREAVRLDPDYAVAWARLGDTYLGMQDTGAGAFDTMIEGARDAASRALEIDSILAAAMAVLGSAEARSGNRKVAEQLLLRAIAIEPNDITAKQYYSGLLWGQLRPQESLVQIDEVLVLDPLSVSAHHRRSSLLNSMGRGEEAIIVARKIVEINPDSPVGYYQEADTEYGRFNWANALVKTMESLEVDPGDPELATGIGDYYLAMELPEEAKRWYDRATEIDAMHPVSRAAPLVLSLYNNEIEDGAKLARQLLEEGVENRQGSQSLVIQAIWADAVRTGRYRETLDYLQEYFPGPFDSNPEWRFDDRYQWIAIGSMMISAGDDDRGRELLGESVRRADEATEIFRPLLLGVEASNGLGDKEGALERLRVFTKDPWSPEIWPIRLRHAPAYELLRDEPEFIELVAGLEQNAAEQRETLPELLAAQ
jgi:TolB-like protein/Tfp pilus assembly protein PilF